MLKGEKKKNNEKLDTENSILYETTFKNDAKLMTFFQKKTRFLCMLTSNNLQKLLLERNLTNKAMLYSIRNLASNESIFIFIVFLIG